MSEKQINIPDGMLRAVEADHEYKFTPTRVIRILQAALRWQNWKLKSLKVLNITPWQAGRNTVINEILQMYLIPETEVDPLVMHIMRHFDDCVADEQERRNRAEAAIGDYQESVKRNAPELDMPTCEECDYIQKEGVATGHAAWCSQFKSEMPEKLIELLEINPGASTVLLSVTKAKFIVREAYRRGVETGVSK